MGLFGKSDHRQLLEILERHQEAMRCWLREAQEHQEEAHRQQEEATRQILEEARQQEENRRLLREDARIQQMMLENTERLSHLLDQWDRQIQRIDTRIGRWEIVANGVQESGAREEP
jgi:hypothetical protein